MTLISPVFISRRFFSLMSYYSLGRVISCGAMSYCNIRIVEVCVMEWRESDFVNYTYRGQDAWDVLVQQEGIRRNVNINSES